MSNNLNAKSNIDIELYIVVSTYNVIEQIEYQWKCRTKSDLKIEMKIRDKGLKESRTRYSKSEVWWIKYHK